MGTEGERQVPFARALEVLVDGSPQREEPEGERAAPPGNSAQPPPETRSEPASNEMSSTAKFEPMQPPASVAAANGGAAGGGKANDDTLGITTQQADEFHASHGYNEVSTQQTPEWQKIAWRYLDWVSLVIIAAAVVSVAVPNEGDRGWTSFTLLLIELNLIVWVGYATDRNAGNAVKELEQLSTPHTIARRDGQWVELAVRELCVGDVIQLKGGDVIPADAKLVGEGEPLKIDESSLTGESLAVTRRPGDEVLSGAVVAQGELPARVRAIGSDTFFGKTMTLLGGPEERGHLQKVLGRVSAALGLLALAGVAAILATMLGRGEPAGYSISLSFVIYVSIVPIGMPVVTAAVLAVGAREMVREKAIVSRLSALEEMSGMEVLASDKTGTLTLNKLTLDKEEIMAWGQYSADDVLRYASLSAQWEHADAIDTAVTASTGKDKGAALAGGRVRRLIPFNPVDKKTAAYMTEADGTQLVAAKGAPQVIADSLDDEAAHDAVTKYIDDRAHRGLRALGVAVSFDEGDTWRLVGCIALLDPPRPDSAETINKAKDLGVEVKMVTGDQRAIAVETSRRLGLGTNIMEGKELMQPGGAGGLATQVDKVDGFAGVYPEHKFKIVEAMQARGRLIGMTGDGVNDAPALKRANVGIAVAGATDAAKGAADIILTEEGIGTIITAIVRSRKIFRRLETYIIYRMASSLLILGFFFFAIIVLRFEIPTWVVVIISLTNDLSVMATSFDKVNSSDMPELWNMTKSLSLAFAIALVGVIATILLLLLADPGYLNWWHWFNTDVSGSPEPGVTSAETIAVMYLALTALIQLNILATRNPSLWWYFSPHTAPRPSLVLITPVAAFLTGATFFAVYWPSDVQPDGGRSFIEGAGWVPIAVTWAYVIVFFFIADFAKFLMARLFRRYDITKEESKRNDKPLPAWVRWMDAPGHAAERMSDRLEEKSEAVWAATRKLFRRGPEEEAALSRPRSEREIKSEMQARLSMRDMSGHIPDDVVNSRRPMTPQRSPMPASRPPPPLPHEHPPHTTFDVGATSGPTTTSMSEQEHGVHRKAPDVARYTVY